MWLLAGLLACAVPTWTDPVCDPRVPDPGEVRVRQLQCSDELIADGEARIGDWMLENAVARFGFRGTYSALYAVDEPGGTLLDAVLWSGEDLGTTPDALSELRVDGDRRTLSAEVDDDGGIARVAFPGMTWTLLADDPVLRLTGPDGGPATATVLPRSSVERTGTSWQGDGFFGGDGSADELDAEAADLPSATTDLALVTPDREAWTRELFASARAVSGRADADAVAVSLGGEVVTRLPVVAGTWSGWAPDGSTLRGERDGCVYAASGLSVGAAPTADPGIRPLACGSTVLQVREQDGNDVTAAFTATDSAARRVLPPGGGSVPVGPVEVAGTVTAGPAYGPVTLRCAPGDAVHVALTREMNTDGAVLADLGREAWPDPDARWASPEAVHDATGDGFGYVVLVADDEIPGDDLDPLDAAVPSPPLAVAAVRSHARAADGSDAGTVVSWPWDPNAKRAAHGVPPLGLSALDLLTVAHDNSGDRRTIVDAAWVDAALAEAPAWAWTDEPLAFRMDALDDLEIYLALLDSFVNVTPVGPSTWVELPGGDRSVPGVEAGLYAGENTAGNGPRIEVFGGLKVGANRVYEVQVDAARRMHVGEVTLWSPAGSATFGLTPLGEPFGGGAVRVILPESAAWVVATVQGADGSWAVRAVR